MNFKRQELGIPRSSGGNSSVERLPPQTPPASTSENLSTTSQPSVEPHGLRQLERASGSEIWHQVNPQQSSRLVRFVRRPQTRAFIRVALSLTRVRNIEPAIQSCQFQTRTPEPSTREVQIQIHYQDGSGEQITLSERLLPNGEMAITRRRVRTHAGADPNATTSQGRDHRSVELYHCNRRGYITQLQAQIHEPILVDGQEDIQIENNTEAQFDGTSLLNPPPDLYTIGMGHNPHELSGRQSNVSYLRSTGIRSVYNIEYHQTRPYTWERTTTIYNQSHDHRIMRRDIVERVQPHGSQELSAHEEATGFSSLAQVPIWRVPFRF